MSAETTAELQQPRLDSIPAVSEIRNTAEGPIFSDVVAIHHSDAARSSEVQENADAIGHETSQGNLVPGPFKKIFPSQLNDWCNQKTCRKLPAEFWLNYFAKYLSLKQFLNSGVKGVSL